ncbi:oxygen-insensitive NAD(P)H nitroreductase [Gammaproteobacteria bacterium AS21]
MNLTDVANFRYSTKEFIKDKKIPDDTFQDIKNLMRLSASSVNAQPWHFIVSNTDEGKQRFAKGVQGWLNFNETKVLNASHVILFCVKTSIEDDYLDQLLTAEDNDGRFAAPEHRANMHGGRTAFVNIHRNDLQDVQHWNEKQVYLNMGSVLLGAGVLGIDAVPMEGIDIAVLNEEFGLTAKGLSAVALVSLGYRADTDFNASLPKSRLAQEELFTSI